MSYNELGGVRTWFEEYGEGEPLVLLHPGGADARAWSPAIESLAERFHVFTPERRGHGRTADVDGPLTYDLMVADTIAFLAEAVGGPAHLGRLECRRSGGAPGRPEATRPDSMGCPEPAMADLLASSRYRKPATSRRRVWDGPPHGACRPSPGSPRGHVCDLSRASRAPWHI
jgi:hypothetical protein